MQKRLSFKTLLLVIWLCARLTQLIGQDTLFIKAGTLVVPIEVIEKENDSLVFFNLHNNEQTSVKAIKEVLKNQRGEYLGLLSGGTRELVLKQKSKSIRLDPNRIFSRIGIEKTLKNYGCLTPFNINLVDSLGKAILHQLSNVKLLVALHNNTGVGYSAKTILNSNAKEHVAAEIFINPENDENDFFYVTEKSKFDYLKSCGYNVVLQDNTRIKDDGSLSVYCGRKKISYINIECESGHLKEQIEMIQTIYKGFVVH